MQRTEYYRKGLPHFHHIGSTFSIVIQLWDAVPMAELVKLKVERESHITAIKARNEPTADEQIEAVHLHFFSMMERLLHAKQEQSYLLSNTGAAEILANKIQQYDGLYYECCGYSILGNHAHLLLDFSIQLPADYDWVTDLPDYVNLDKVMKLIKGGSASGINKLLQRKGAVYRSGYYNRYIRDQKHFTQAFWYIVRNAEMAGLCDSWRNHAYSYGNPKYTELQW